VDAASGRNRLKNQRDGDISSLLIIYGCVEDDTEPPDDLLHRDFERYEGYWHGFTFIIFDSEDPGDQWIRSTRWVPVAVGDPEERRDPEDQPD